MKNQLIASLVGGVLLFLWQFLSWNVLGVHSSEMQYTENQDAILKTLAENLQEGTYILPLYAPGSTSEQKEEYMSTAGGKPWAHVHYDTSMATNMGMSMVRGFFVDLVAAFLLVWLLLKFQRLDFKTVLLSSLAVGGIAYLTIPYLNSIWFESNSLGHLVDLVGQWGLVGLWLGWWLPRNQRA